MVLRNCGGGSAGEAASPQTLSSTTLIFVFAVPQQVNIGLMSFLWVKLRPAQGDRYAHVKPHHALRPVGRFVPNFDCWLPHQLPIMHRP